MNKTILVLGGTGLLGLPVSQRLNKAGFQVRILTRDRQKAQALLDDSFQVVEGDIFDASCLDIALDGCYGVHISLPGEVEQPAAERIAQAAPRHGVKRITYISGASVAEERRWFAMVDRKFRAEAAIQASGVPYTIFCPTWLMESLPLFVVQGRASVLGKQPTPTIGLRRTTWLRWSRRLTNRRQGRVDESLCLVQRPSLCTMLCVATVPRSIRKLSRFQRCPSGWLSCWPRSPATRNSSLLGR